MKVAALGLVLTCFVAACSMPPAGQLFHTTLLHRSPSNPTGDYPLPVAIGDQTELVVGIEPAEGDQGGGPEPFVRLDPADPNALILTWVGGMCDNDAAVSFRPSGSGYALHLDVHGKLGFGCPAAGILRGLRIVASKAIEIRAIAVSGAG